MATFKLCNARNCLDGFEPCPHNAVHPCHVFYNETTGMWHDEMTSKVIPVLELADGTKFNPQNWLHTQMAKAFKGWTPKRKVHEPYRKCAGIQGRKGIPAQAPKHTNEQLDQMADHFIRTRRDVTEIFEQIKQLGQEISGYQRMLRKWQGNAMIERRIETLRRERDELRGIQSELDQGSKVAKAHLKSEHIDNQRWVKPRGRWEDFILAHTDHRNRLWIIDRNGLKCNENYLFLPKEDGAFFQSALHAQKMHHIPTTVWLKVPIPKEAIGDTIRRLGKKNTSGRRIRARAEQKRFATEVLDMMRFLRDAKVPVDSFADDMNLWLDYDEKVSPKITRK